MCSPSSFVGRSGMMRNRPAVSCKENLQNGLGHHDGCWSSNTIKCGQASSQFMPEHPNRARLSGTENNDYDFWVGWAEKNKHSLEYVQVSSCTWHRIMDILPSTPASFAATEHTKKADVIKSYTSTYPKSLHLAHYYRYFKSYYSRKMSWFTLIPQSQCWINVKMRLTGQPKEEYAKMIKEITILSNLSLSLQ